MGFFNRIKDTFRDKTRDKLCSYLQTMGIDAQMAERGRPQESIDSVVSTKTLGIIDIAKGPIRWVNVTNRIVPGGFRWTGRVIYDIKYVVPDTRLRAKSAEVQIKSSVVGNTWQWKGRDSGLGVIDRLNSNTSMAHALIQSNSAQITIRAYPDYRLWVMSTVIDQIRLTPYLKSLPHLWDLYQSIARHLLSEWS